jgi:hypothetical protein
MKKVKYILICKDIYGIIHLHRCRCRRVGVVPALLYVLDKK